MEIETLTIKSKAGIIKPYNVYKALICWYSEILEEGTFYGSIFCGTCISSFWDI